jgi:hypothetical protein
VEPVGARRFSRVLLGAPRGAGAREAEAYGRAAAAARRPNRRYESAGGLAVCWLESGAGRGSAPWMVGISERGGGGCSKQGDRLQSGPEPTPPQNATQTEEDSGPIIDKRPEKELKPDRPDPSSTPPARAPCGLRRAAWDVVRGPPES